MASIHIDEIRKFLIDQGRGDATDEKGNSKVNFLEIMFDDPENRDAYIADEEMVDKVISLESYFGSGVLQFDERGCIKSLDFS